MATVHRQDKAHAVGLDPKFLMVVSSLWSAIKLFFKITKQTSLLSYVIIMRLCGKQVSLKSDSKDDVKILPETGSLLKNTKDDSFLNYGGIKWYSRLTPQALRNASIKKFPKGTAVTFKCYTDKGLKDYDISIYGDLFEEQVVNIESAIDRIIEEFKPDNLFIKEIHILKELGKYLDQSGVPDSDIIGFSLDNESACLIHEEAALDQELCYAFIRRIVKEELNREKMAGKARDTLWNQAASIKERLINNREYQETDNRKKYGALRNRPIIDLDSPVCDGVYLGAPAHEAILVNRDSDFLNQTFKNFLAEVRKIKEALGLGFEEKVMNIALKICKQTFPHNTQEAVNRLRINHRIAVDEEIALDFFMQNETGDAEHSALLLAFLMEKLNKEQPNFLGGKVSIDRNWVPGGGHAWVRYSRGQSDIYIIDPHKNYLGRLDNYSAERWPYERRSDLQNQRVSRPL